MADALSALVPSLGLALLFWFVIRAVLRADRTEREQLARLEREDRERTGGERAGVPADSRADPDRPRDPRTGGP